MGGREKPSQIAGCVWHSVHMTEENVSVTRVIDAEAQTIFGVLADPTTHAEIDGTGWVCEALDATPLTAPGQIFRMSMYHEDHPNGQYEVVNRVELLEPPKAISWEPGSDAGNGTLRFGGWIWRYDLTPVGSSTTSVTLSYDWSAVSGSIREHIGFPPFGPEHLANSLDHLAELVSTRPAP